MKIQLPALADKKTKKSVGLDIGFHTVKIVELINRESGFEIVRFAVKEIPKAVLEQKNRAEALGKLVKRMFAESKISSNMVYLSVSGHNVVIRQADLPKMPPEELIDAARWNAREEVLFPVEDAAVDCYVMDEIEKEGADYYQLLSVIVRADIIPFLVSIARNAGLKPCGVTIIPIALWDYDRVANKPKPGGVTSYIDMGAERTRVYFVADEKLLFSREIPNGGKNITAALVGKYAIENDATVTVDEMRAEAIKKTHGLPAEDSRDKTQEGIPLAQIRERVLPVVARQAEEFQRSLDYFRNQYKVTAVHRMILSGGAVSLKGLYQFLAQNMDIAIDRCNALMQSTPPLTAVDTADVKLLGPSLTTAAGLAIGRCDKINVLPEEFRYSLKKTLIKWAPFSALPLLLVTLLVFSIVYRGSIETKQQLLKEKQNISRELQAKVVAGRVPLEDLSQLKNLKQQLEKEKSQLPRVANPVDLRHVLDELSRLTPANTSLSKLSYIAGDDSETQEAAGRQKGWVSLEGIIFGNEVRVLETLTAFLDKLKSSPVFKEVKLEKSQAIEGELYTSPGLDFNLSLLPVPRQENGTQEARR